MATAEALLRVSTPIIRRRGLTLVGVAPANLGEPGVAQLKLPLARSRETRSALDRIHGCFGSTAITRGVQLLPD